VTEEQWLASTEISRMLSHLASRKRKISSRKFRLLVCAIARHVWPLLTDPRSRRGIEVAEQFADCLVGRKELQAAWQEAEAVRRRGLRSPANLAVSATQPSVALDRVAKPAVETAMLRHLVGDPFHPYAAPHSWPPLVADLAQQLYDGADVRLILHDALLDAGHADLAEHFRQEAVHPKGCWVLDLVLQRK
jgi:hypothetical protein